MLIYVIVLYILSKKGDWDNEGIYYKRSSTGNKNRNGSFKRACEEGLINAIALSNGQWRIAESALQEALHKGIDLRSLPKRSKKMKQPEALRKAQEEIQKNRAKTTVAATSTAVKPTKPTKSTKTSK